MDRNILQHDIHVPTDYISKFSGHRHQRSGLKWSHDDPEFVSGGDDNQLLVWNQRSQQLVLRLSEHTAAVKAIARSLHQHSLVALGGGTADRCIRFWNMANGNMLNSIDTGSQVCNLGWCKNVNELSQNHIVVWKYPHLCQSHSGFRLLLVTLGSFSFFEKPHLVSFSRNLVFSDLPLEQRREEKSRQGGWE